RLQVVGGEMDVFAVGFGGAFVPRLPAGGSVADGDQLEDGALGFAVRGDAPGVVLLAAGDGWDDDADRRVHVSASTIRSAAWPSPNGCGSGPAGQARMTVFSNPSRSGWSTFQPSASVSG